MTKSRVASRKDQVDDLDEVDISQLRNPIQISGKPVQQILNSVHYGSPELRSLLLDECDLIFECKICRALFRDLPNFISHKRVYCKKSHLEDIHVAVANLPEEKVVVVLPKAPEETEKSTPSSSDSVKKKAPKSTLEQTIQRIQTGELGKSHAYQVYTEAAEKLQRQKEEMKVATIRTTPIPTNKNAVFMDVDVTSVNIHERQKASAQNAATSSTESQGVVTRKRGEKPAPSSSSLAGKGVRKASKPEKHSCELQKLLMQELKEIQKQKAQDNGEKLKGGQSQERLRQRLQDSGKTVSSKKEVQPPSSVKQMPSSNLPSPKKSSATLDLARQNFQTLLEKPGDKATEKYGEKSTPVDHAVVKRRKGLKEVSVKNEKESHPAKLKQMNSKTLTFAKHKKVRNSLMCVTCNTIFSSKNSLNFHRKIHHSGKRTFYPCPYCPSAFYYFHGVTRHLSQSHSKSPEEIDRMRKQLRDKSYTKSFSRQTSKKVINNNSSARRSSRRNDEDFTQITVVTPKGKTADKQPREAAEKNLLNVVASVLKQQAKVQKASENELKAAQARQQSPKAVERPSPGSAKTKSFNNNGDAVARRSTSAEASRSKRLKARQLESDDKPDERSRPRRNETHKSLESTPSSSLLIEAGHSPTFYTCKKCQRGFGRKISFENHIQVCKTVQKTTKAATPKSGDVKLKTVNAESVSTSATSRTRDTKSSEVTSTGRNRPTLPETPVSSRGVRDGSNDSRSTTSSRGSALDRGTSPQGKASGLRENEDLKKQDGTRSRSRERKPAESSRRDSSSSSSRSGSSRRGPIRRVSPSPLGHLRLRHAPVQKEEIVAQNKSIVTNNEPKREFEIPKTPCPDEDNPQADVVKIESMSNKSDVPQDSTRRAGSLECLKSGGTESPVTSKSPLLSANEVAHVKEDKDVNYNSNEKTGPEESEIKSLDLVSSLEAKDENKETAVDNGTGSMSGAEKEEELQIKEETDSDASTGLVKRNPERSSSARGQRGNVTVVSALSERPKRKRKVPMRNLDAEEMLTKIHRPSRDAPAPKKPRLGRNSSKKREDIKRVINDGKDVDAKSDTHSSDEYSEDAESSSPKEDRGEEMTRSKGRSTSNRIYVIGQKKGEARRRNVQCYDLSRIGKFMDSDSLRCLECGGTFSTVFNIRRHIIRCHLRWSRFKCKLCKFQSFDISECKTHIARNHSITAVNRAGRSVNSLIIDLTKQGSQARNLKKSRTIKGKQEVESKAGNIYARPTTRRLPRLPERSAEKSLSQEEDKKKCLVDKDKEGEQRKEEGKKQNASEVGKQKNNCLAEQTASKSKSVTVTASPVSAESQAVKSNLMPPGGNRKSLPFNISTRNSPRVFDTRPYKAENASSANCSPARLETRKGTYTKPTVVSVAGGKKQASSDKSFSAESSDVIDAAKVLASLNDKPKEGGYSAVQSRNIFENLEKATADSAERDYHSDVDVQPLSHASDESSGTARIVRTAFSESVSGPYSGSGTSLEPATQPINKLQRGVDSQLIKSLIVLSDSSSRDAKKINSPTSTKAATEQSKLPVTSSPAVEVATDPVSNDVQESNACLKNAHDHAGEPASATAASASKPPEKPVSPTGLAGKSSIILTKKQAGKVVLYTAKVPDRSAPSSALTTSQSTVVASNSVSTPQSSSSPSVSTSLTYDTNLVPSGTFVIRKHFI